MYAATTSVALVGGDAREVRVEAHVGRQTEAFKLSGLPDTAVREAKNRVRAAITSSGIRFPNREVTINLAPADLPKRGVDYDLPIALGVLSASREIPPIGNMIVVGELALNGEVRPGASSLVAGVLSSRSGAAALVARDSAGDAAAVPGAQVYGVSTLAETVDLIRRGVDSKAPSDPAETPPSSPALDLSDITGQPLAKRALEIAAAGRHHLLFHGPPGAGKTMLASRLPGLLPELDDSEMIEVAMVWAGAGRSRGLNRVPPFRSPHHTASRSALVGGGTGVVVPGEVSLAHRGVLFLDELAEFPRGHLDTLRQPLESGVVSVSRQGVSTTFPALFQLVAATNPCPCGFYGDDRRPCDCRPGARERYQARISGPLLDRFDLIVHVARVELGDDCSSPEPTAVVRSRVERARPLLDESAPTTRSELIADAVAGGRLTLRGAARVERVAKTIAALDDEADVGEPHLAEALALRGNWVGG